jgi:DNA methylase
MSDHQLIIPKVARELVPSGWWEAHVLPWSEKQESIETVQKADSDLAGMLAKYRKLGYDGVELEKAQRILEVRIGELLGPGKSGPQSSHASEDLNKDDKYRFRLLVPVKNKILDYLRNAETAKECSRAKLLRLVRINEESQKRTIDVQGIDLRHGDFKKILADVQNIDAIITDPPYPAEYLDCFSDLSLFASEHLKDDGFCVVYSGQYHLPEVIRRLSEHLTYVWTFCLYHVGKKQLVNGVNIMCGWKPILIFSKGRKKMRFSAYDVVESVQMEKHSHEWQQSESGAAKLIEIFSAPGELIVDPFAGSGTFLKVAHDLGREAIGAEID